MTETAEPKAMTDWQVEERLEQIAPHPDPDKGVTAEGLARYFAVRAQLGFTRNVTPLVRDDQLVPAWQVCLEFAAAHLLYTLQGEMPELADMAAQHIAQAWDDGEMGAWLHEYLTAAGIDPREVSRLDEARLALENAARSGVKPCGCDSSHRCLDCAAGDEVPAVRALAEISGHVRSELES